MVSLVNERNILRDHSDCPPDSLAEFDLLAVKDCGATKREIRLLVDKDTSFRYGLGESVWCDWLRSGSLRFEDWRAALVRW